MGDGGSQLVVDIVGPNDWWSDGDVDDLLGDVYC